MSLLNLLNNEDVWNDYLIYKQKSIHIPTKELKKLETFIKEKKNSIFFQRI